jgi:hypothetical protein
MIEKAFLRGKWFYNIYNIQDAILQNAGPCQIDLLLPQVEKLEMYDNKWMSQTSILRFLNWYADSAPSEYLYTLNGLTRAIKEDRKKTRANAKKYRWDVAYAQGYKCMHCKSVLHPKAFEIDHREELRCGGTDDLHNLQALCSNCHAKKTRSYTSSM